jgi:hypothetical protein
MPQLGASLLTTLKDVIYDYNVFIIQATGLVFTKLVETILLLKLLYSCFYIIKVNKPINISYTRNNIHTATYKLHYIRNFRINKLKVIYKVTSRTKIIESALRCSAQSSKSLKGIRLLRPRQLYPGVNPIKLFTPLI